MSGIWECKICNKENPGYALFCQNKKCEAVRGAWRCRSCGYKVVRVEGVSLPANIENCPNCGDSHN